MNEKPQEFSQPEHGAAAGCLRIVEEQIKIFQDCLHGKKTMIRPLLLEHIKQAQKLDSEKLAAIDKEIAQLESQIKELELQAAEFRRAIKEK